MEGDDPLAVIGLELDGGLPCSAELMGGVGLLESCCMEGDDPLDVIGLELAGCSEIMGVGLDDEADDPLAATGLVVGCSEIMGVGLDHEADGPLAAIGLELDDGGSAELMGGGIGLPEAFCMEDAPADNPLAAIGLELDDGGLVGCSLELKACCMEEAPDDDGDDPLAAIGLAELMGGGVGLSEACCMEEAPDDDDDPPAAIGLELDDGGLVGNSAELIGGVGLLEACCMEEDDGGLVGSSADLMGGVGLLGAREDDEFVHAPFLFLLACEMLGPAPSSPSSISFSSGSILSRICCTTLRSPVPLYCAMALGHDDTQNAHFL